MGHVLTFNSVGALICSRINCSRQKLIGRRQNVAFIPVDDGLCYQLNSSTPCRSSSGSSLVDFDVFKLKPKCSDIKSPVEEYEDDELDATYNQLYPDYDFYHFVLVGGVKKNQKRLFLTKSKRRQDSLTSGLFQVPNAFPDQLLNPCRPGSRNGNNFKCRNSFM